METTYSIMNISEGLFVPVDGLTGLTHGEALTWIIEIGDIINYTIQEDIL
jgi:hypothetical protein